MIEKALKPCGHVLVASGSPESQIVDAVHIDNVASVVDRQRDSTVARVWWDDGLKCALLINEYPHAAFDCSAKRGYCGSNSAHFAPAQSETWSTADHSWPDDAMNWSG